MCALRIATVSHGVHREWSHVPPRSSECSNIRCVHQFKLESWYIKENGEIFLPSNPDAKQKRDRGSEGGTLNTRSPPLQAGQANQGLLGGLHPGSLVPTLLISLTTWRLREALLKSINNNCA